MRIGVLASGRGSNLQALIEVWKQGMLGADIVAVGSDREDALALQRAQDVGVLNQAFPLRNYGTRGEQEGAILSWLREQGVELLVLAGFMRVLSKEFLQACQIPVINIHPSLLPAFQGLHAQRQAVEYGVKLSGCTVHYVDEGLDSGPIILQEAVAVLPDDTEASLSDRILEVEHRIYPEAVKLVATGRVSRQGRVVEILD
ncbi:formyltetrahydrofolate-dependent phosphoribosylglycinamide formyltransferase [Desulfitobacterium dichloroeliminans LMG P-21439]|uniref:Phosphoribosylglycinamide formyltransferase n=1 Tax=Desulfitobacterium dichloroeliminans (strain LMG P-21439 / DCA1) TaxID=871963 RepID=L0F6T2_DESDL|nr:phosphoribosylglycinamide formyltransferase [Desulfitobacterium dichloroeliminans]AGA68735.1 formyltetrahydrofolate-dependent phosphoribosylglycinamide formyltransferase [Desulfitobacterium dichloroeliminans LMG P-21439]